MKKVLFLISIPAICLFMAGGVLADPPANDDCIDATDAGSLKADSTVQLSGIMTDATNGCTDFWYSEVWVKFTVTACMDVTIDFCDDGNYVYDVSEYIYGTCPCDDAIYRSTSSFCSNINPSKTWYSLEAGTYYYPIWSEMGFADYTVNITGVDCPTTPDNDDCANAEPVGDVSDLDFNTRAASFDGEGTCMSSPNIWYVYTATFTGEARVSLTADYNTQLAVYDGYSCSPLSTRLGCSENSLLDFQVVTGQEYLIEVGGMEDETGSGSITIAEAPEKPANDDCADATDAGTLMADSTVQISGTLLNATLDCDYSEASEVWVKFTIASCMDVTIDFCDDMNMVESPSMYLFTECPCDGRINYLTFEYCGIGNPSCIWEGLEAGTYYYPVWSLYGYDSYVVNINGTDCPAVPANDDCANATEIGEVNGYEFYTRSATYDGSGSCITSGGNIWFVYTPSFTDTVRIDLSGSDFNPTMAVYDGYDCSSLPSQIFCTDELQYDFEADSGQQYLIEIGSAYGYYGNGLLTIGEKPEIPFNDDCEDADDGDTLQSGVTVQFTGTTVAATRDCWYNSECEVWIKFTIPSCMNLTIDFCDNVDNVESYARWLHYDCSCNDIIYSSITGDCENSNPSFTWSNLEAGTYYYAIWQNDGIGGDYVVNVMGQDCPEPDFVVTAPYTGSSSTCGAGNDCIINGDGEDHIYEVTIPEDGNWAFSLCNSSELWESSIYLGSSVCENDLGSDQSGCDNGHAELIIYEFTAGTYYLTIDNNSTDCGEYTLDIYSIPDFCDDSYYTNGGPLYDGGIRVDSYRDELDGEYYYAADDFTITEEITLSSITFFGIFSITSEEYFNDAADYQIMDGSSGEPGTVLYEGTDVPCTRTLTGSLQGIREYYTYEIEGLDITLPAGTYFLACRTVSSTNFSISTESQTGAFSYYKTSEEGSWELEDHEIDLAFCLFATTGSDEYEYLPGDANMAAETWPAQTIGGDVTYLVNYFRGLADACYLDGFYASADATGDCLVVGGDVTYLVNYFRGLADMSYCSDYEPAWPTPSDVPAEAPDGWPNCD